MLTLHYNWNEIQCPHCKTEFGARWDNEYGDAEVGHHEVECLKCRKIIKLEVTINYQVLK